MKRYGINYGGGVGTPILTPNPEGPWVKYEDANRLRTALERCRDHFRECDRTTRGPSPMERMCEEALK